MFTHRFHRCYGTVPSGALFFPVCALFFLAVTIWTFAEAPVFEDTCLVPLPKGTYGYRGMPGSASSLFLKVATTSTRSPRAPNG